MIHVISLDVAKLRSLQVSDWWSIDPITLERIVCSLLVDESNQTSRVRRRGEYGVIAGKKFGARAEKIEVELAALALNAHRVLSENKADSVLRALTAWHILFENIHPLTQGNGRVGRAILAGQIHQSLGIDPAELLGSLYAQEMDYVAAFVNNEPRIMFELLLDLFAQLTGRVISPESVTPPFDLSPRHVDSLAFKGRAENVRSRLSTMQ